MKATHAQGLVAFAAIAMLSIGLAGCAPSDSSGGEGGSGSNKEASESSTNAQEEAQVVPDLNGEWIQSNSNSPDAFQAATIADGTIVVNWVSDGGDTRSLYWAGTFESPTTVDEPYSWESQNDTAQTGSAMLASGDPTKTFTYEGGVLSYEVTALGTTTTVKLEQE